MRSVKAQNRAVGPRGSLLQAPAGGLGADFKTTPSWGGRSSPLGPNGDAAGLPSGLVVRRYKRRTAYRTTNFDVVVRLVAELLHRVAVSSRGNVYYLNGRRMRMLLSLDAPIHPIDLSVVYEVLSRLGFEVVEQSRGKYVVIRMDNPIMREVKGARSFDEILEIVKKHLNNGE